MMRVIDHTGELDDLWPLHEGEVLPRAGRALLPLERLAEAVVTDLEIGVQVPNHADARAVVPHFSRLAMISIEFPSFSDGRGFSLAKRIRRAGFVGRLRATGPVIADQFAYLLMCGFDEVAIPQGVAARQPVESFLEEARSISLGYQRGMQGEGSILDRRRAAV